MDFRRTILIPPVGKWSRGKTSARRAASTAIDHRHPKHSYPPPPPPHVHVNHMRVFAVDFRRTILIPPVGKWSRGKTSARRATSNAIDHHHPQPPPLPPHTYPPPPPTQSPRARELHMGVCAVDFRRMILIPPVGKCSSGKTSVCRAASIAIGLPTPPPPPLPPPSAPLRARESHEGVCSGCQTHDSNTTCG